MMLSLQLFKNICSCVFSQTKAELAANGDSITLASANSNTNSATGSTTGDGNTSVLAELAALAEATASNTGKNQNLSFFYRS